jgi:hypothetical protein
MTIASPAVRGAQRPLVTTPVPGPSAPEDLRDELTRQRLLSVVDHLTGMTVESFDRWWWDGQVRLPSLVVRTGRRMRRLRIVETEGTCVVVPFSRRLAQRWLAARRRPQRAELDRAISRPLTGLVFDGWTDAIRCSTRGCAALRPLDYPGCCPLCGG